MIERRNCVFGIIQWHVSTYHSLSIIYRQYEIADIDAVGIVAERLSELAVDDEVRRDEVR